MCQSDTQGPKATTMSLDPTCLIVWAARSTSRAGRATGPSTHIDRRPGRFRQLGEAESSTSARAFGTTSLAQVQPEPGTLADTADSGVALAHLLEMVRGMCEMVRYVDSGRDAATLVRRARGLELLVRTALKDCTVLEEEQFELRQEAAEAHVRTQRRAGELLSELQKHRGGRPPRAASRVEEVGEPPLTLRELGIDGHESHRWQRIASVPEDAFERYIETCRARRTEIITANVLA